MTPLHYAASKANLTAVKELLQFDGVKIDVSFFNYNIKNYIPIIEPSRKIEKSSSYWEFYGEF